MAKTLIYLFLYFSITVTNYFFLPPPPPPPAALGLRCRTRAFSSCGGRRLLLVAVRELLIAVASLVAEHGL